MGAGGALTINLLFQAKYTVHGVTMTLHNIMYPNRKITLGQDPYACYIAVP